MLEILTLLNKVERVSRIIDPDNFLAVPGLWAEVQADGSLANITTDTPGVITKLVIGNASDNIYESHDVSVGRITTVESIGIRAKVDTEGFDGSTIAQGDLLVVSDKAGAEGKLVSIIEKPNTEAGNYEIVARAEEVDVTAGYIIFRTVSPVILTLT